MEHKLREIGIITLSCGHVGRKGTDVCPLCESGLIILSCGHVVQKDTNVCPCNTPGIIHEKRVLAENVFKFEHQFGTITADFSFSIIMNNIQDNYHITLVYGNNNSIEFRMISGNIGIITTPLPGIIVTGKDIDGRSIIHLSIDPTEPSVVVRGDLGIYYDRQIPKGRVLAENVFIYEHQFGTITADFSFSLINRLVNVDNDLVLKFGNDYSDFRYMGELCGWTKPYAKRNYFDATVSKVDNRWIINIKKN